MMLTRRDRLERWKHFGVQLAMTFARGGALADFASMHVFDAALLIVVRTMHFDNAICGEEELCQRCHQ